MKLQPTDKGEKIGVKSVRTYHWFEVLSERGFTSPKNENLLEMLVSVGDLAARFDYLVQSEIR